MKWESIYKEQNVKYIFYFPQWETTNDMSIFWLYLFPVLHLAAILYEARRASIYSVNTTNFIFLYKNTDEKDEFHAKLLNLHCNVRS